MAENQFDWVEFYSAFAHELLKYKDNRKELIEKVNEVNDFLRTLLKKKEVAKLDINRVIDDIDPFTVFGIFNKQMKEENRLKVIKRLQEIFNLKAKIPINLHGIPTLFGPRAAFYPFGESHKEKDNLWNLFESALKYSDNKNNENLNILEKDFDLAITQQEIGISKITMGLFWVASDTFLNLDATNINYIYNSNVIPKELIDRLPDVKIVSNKEKMSFQKYFEMLNIIEPYLTDNSIDFRQFSYDAWQFSEKNKKENVDDYNGKRYWIYSPGRKAVYWEEFYRNKIMAISDDNIGSLKNFSSKDEIRQKMLETIKDSKVNFKSEANMSWQFIHAMKLGDIVFAKKGRQIIVGRGEVVGEYEYDNNRKIYKNVRKINWTNNGEWKYPEIKINNNKKQNKASMYTLVDITHKVELVNKIEALFKDDNITNSKNPNNLNKTISSHLNQILYGPPGTGKTYNTVIEAMRIINPNLIDEYEKNQKNYDEIKEEFDKAKKEGQIEFITFHQSYAYEEFVEGIKPYLGEEWGESSERLTYNGDDGIFKKLGNRALVDRLEINKEKRDKIIDFEFIKDKFKEKYQLGEELETFKSQSKFKIEKYTENSLRIRPLNSEYVFSISFDYLEDAFNKNLEKDEDIVNIIGMPKGLSTYYRSIYSKFMDIYNTEVKHNSESERKTVSNPEEINNKRTKLVKDYYKRRISLKENVNDSQPYVLIIDEINRGNISKIFGELITLIEEDKRESFSVRLPYSHEEFTVPKNLYIIGTMNTSDRSIASIDIALRRRFTFKEMMPDSKLVADFGVEFSKKFKELNNRIRILLDRDHQIGHSYFIKTKYNNENNNNNIKTLKEIWFNCIMPLLNEYFYNDWEKLQALFGKAKLADDNHNYPSFVKKIEKVDFADSDYQCDENEQYDFVSDTEIDFEKALKNAFTKKTS